MRFSLGTRANQWNEIARTDAHVFKIVRGRFYERLGCKIMGEIEASDLRVLVGIAARTLRFHKFAEAISLTELCEGLRDVDGTLILDDAGDPYFAGCNISKPDTVSAAVCRLERSGLITRWAARRPGWSTVYMPFAEEWLAETSAAESGAIAEDCDFAVLGEHWRRSDGQIIRIGMIAGDTVRLVPVSERLYGRGEEYEQSAGEWVASDCERLSVHDILRARKH